MPMFQQSIWFEDTLPDYIRANIVTEPGPSIIRSATSNYQRSPKWLVLLDGKYQVSQLQNVSVTRSRTIASNTATITIVNVDNRYSGPNKTKISVNIPISIFFGFEDEYLQHYEGYIDTTSMTTNAQGSIITIQCRDKAKQFLEQKISAGVFAGPPEDDAWDYNGYKGVALDDGYLGYMDWHYEPRWDSDGNLLRYPKTWTSKEVLLDICYKMGLKDLGEYVYVTRRELPSGEFVYERHIKYQSDFDLRISADMNTPLVTNFVEMPPLDCVAKVAQAILHEAVFDVDGRLIVRPIKTSKDPAVFYMKEERDIASITEDVDDDRLVNICTIIGQTAKESAVIYPFAPVSVIEKVTLDKGQDLYSWSITYPKVVSSENAKTVLKANVWAPVIHPYGQLFPDPVNNPENRPQFDTRTYFPTFAAPYEKGEVLTGSCAIVTDTADWAPRGNKRKMWFCGALEEAVQFEFQPIMLKDRFGKTVRVVCRERAYPGNGPGEEQWDLIVRCGNTPFVPDITKPDPDDDGEVEPIPAELYGLDGTVDDTGRLHVVELENIPTESFTPVYDGLALGTDGYMLVGWVSEAGRLPSTAPTPLGIIPNDVATLYGINMLVARQVVPGEPYKDSFGNHRVVRNMVFYHCSKTITVNTYRPPSGTQSPVQVCITNVDDFKDTSNAVIIADYLTDPNDYTVGCAVAQDPNDTTGQYHIVLPYLDQAPAGWILDSQDTVTIQYPVVVYSTSPTQFGTVGEWHYVIWDTYLIGMNVNINTCKGLQLRVAGGRVPVWMMQSGDPDTNCIYWMWNGGYKRFNDGRDGVEFQDDAAYDASQHPITFNDGDDWNGDGRALIHRDTFYKYAQDPNTTIIELTTDGLDGKSSAELIELTENYIVAFGHNYYGNMEAEFRAMADELEKMMDYIGAALVLLSLAMTVASQPQPVVTTGGSGTSSGTAAGAMTVTLGGALAFLFGLAMLFTGIGAGNGRNISKVMENLNVRVTGVRREEIHLYQNSSQQASWWVTNAMNHITGRWHVQTSDMKHQMFPFEDEIGYGWVFVMDLTKEGDASIPFPDGCYVTSFLWETPEIGDRNFIDYYETQPIRTERSYRFKVEAFGNDEINGYSAEYLLAKRFAEQDITDNWWDSYGYEVLVDRSMDDVSVTDTGLGWHFFERREDYQPRIYKYVSLMVYSAKETTYSNTDVDVLLQTTEHVVPGSQPQENQVFAMFTEGQEWEDEPAIPVPPPGAIEIGVNPVDAVFLIDTSGSTEALVDMLAGNAMLFANALKDAGVPQVNLGICGYTQLLGFVYTDVLFTGSGDLWTEDPVDFARGADTLVSNGGYVNHWAAVEHVMQTYHFDERTEDWYRKHIIIVTDTDDESGTAAEMDQMIEDMVDGRFRLHVINKPMHQGTFDPALTATEGTFTSSDTVNWGSVVAGKIITKYETSFPPGEPIPVVVPPAYSLNGQQRWGMLVIRGLNPSWYAKYRWLEDKTEQNYARFKVLHAGQERLTAHIYNNTRFSTVTMDIRIWGKAYGKFAPTIVYYHEQNLLSIWSYGLRQLTLTNDCINDYDRARYIARKLACASNVAYKMRVTGKGFLKEGDIITVKEETTGALAGTFRVWENTFLSPVFKTCTVPANQLLQQSIEGVYEPRSAIPSTNNNVMIACGGNGRPTYILEVDAASNPVWYAKAGANYEPGFILRIDGPGSIASVVGGGAPIHQVKTIVGVRESQDVVVLDYAVAVPLEHYYVNAPILCGCTDEQQKYLWVGTTLGITCIDLVAQQPVYVANIGPVHGIAAVNNQVWDAQQRDDVYRECGCIFVAQTNGVHAYQNWSDEFTHLGPRLATFANIPTGNPMSLTFSKSLSELVYVNGHTTTKNGTIHGISVQVDYDVDHPEDGVIATFVEELWQMDYFNDAEIMHMVPNIVQRREYIAEFFQPVHAERDVNNELIVTDNANNRVYKINPTGKFYITEITTSVDVTNNGTSYMHDISAIVVENAVSTMLTNFGQNFLTEKTDEQIEAQSSVGMGAIRKIMPKGKYRVQLLGSTTYVTAYNNSNDTALRVGDTVLVSYGFGQKNMCAIIGRKPLNDWTVETGEPYTTVDATTIDVTKYGQATAEGQNSQAGSSTDLTTLYAQLREMRNELNMLKGLHGING